MEKRNNQLTIQIMNKGFFSLLILIVFAVMGLGCDGSSASSKDDEKGKEEATAPASISEKTIASHNAGKSPVHLTTADFKEKVFNYEANQEWKYEGDLPCIIDFYADWCAPCKRIAPILEELAVEYDGKLIVYKINTDQERELAAAFGIQSIPSLLFVPASGKPQMAQGALSKKQFQDAIDNFLLKKQ